MSWDSEPPKPEEMQAWDATPPPPTSDPNKLVADVQGNQPTTDTGMGAGTPQQQIDFERGGFNKNSTNPAGQQMLENAGVAAGGYGVGNLAARAGSAAIGSDLGQALLNSPQSIGAKMNALEVEKGVTGRLPELRGSQIGLQPPEMNAPVNATPTSYPLDKNTFLNSASDRMSKWGNQLTPQETMDYHRQIADYLSRGKILKNTPIGAQASQINAQATNLTNEMIPGRAELAEQYKNALHARQGLAALGKYGAGTLAAGAGAAGIYKLFH